MTTEASTYSIGKPGVAWGSEEKNIWLNAQTQKRSYFDDVVAVVESLANQFDVEQYGELTYAEHGFADYPLLLVKSKNWQADKPIVIVTGGVHGYETSGVHGALRFLQTEALKYTEQFNVLVAPCISPWGYETINRWNPETTDPNRSFLQPSPAPEAAQIMAYVGNLSGTIAMHIDLHETTDTDNTEFRPALAARDGIVNTNWNIPDGFYLVGDSQNPAAAFQKAVLDSVEKITHIAEADEQGELIGVPMAQFGVINYDGKRYGLCMGLSSAEYVTTTEVYPDSANATPEECVLAQVAAVVGGLNYVAAHIKQR